MAEDPSPLCTDSVIHELHEISRRRADLFELEERVRRACTHFTAAGTCAVQRNHANTTADVIFCRACGAMSDMITSRPNVSLHEAYRRGRTPQGAGEDRQTERRSVSPKESA